MIVLNLMEKEMSRDVKSSERLMTVVVVVKVRSEWWCGGICGGRSWEVVVSDVDTNGVNNFGCW